MESRPAVATIKMQARSQFSLSPAGSPTRVSAPLLLPVKGVTGALTHKRQREEEKEKGRLEVVDDESVTSVVIAGKVRRRTPEEVRECEKAAAENAAFQDFLVDMVAVSMISTCFRQRLFWTTLEVKPKKMFTEFLLYAVAQRDMYVLETVLRNRKLWADACAFQREGLYAEMVASKESSILPDHPSTTYPEIIRLLRQYGEPVVDCTCRRMCVAFETAMKMDAEARGENLEHCDLYEKVTHLNWADPEAVATVMWHAMNKQRRWTLSCFLLHGYSAEAVALKECDDVKTFYEKHCSGSKDFGRKILTRFFTNSSELCKNSERLKEEKELLVIVSESRKLKEVWVSEWPCTSQEQLAHAFG